MRHFILFLICLFTINISIGQTFEISSDTIKSISYCGDSVYHQITIKNTGNSSLLIDPNLSSLKPDLGVMIVLPDILLSNQGNLRNAINSFKEANIDLRQVTPSSTNDFNNAVTTFSTDVVIHGPRRAGSFNVSSFKNGLLSFANDGGSVVMMGANDDNVNLEIFNSGLFSGEYVTKLYNTSIESNVPNHPILDSVDVNNFGTTGYTVLNTISNPDYTPVLTSYTYDLFGYRDIGDGKAYNFGYNFSAASESWHQILRNIFREAIGNKNSDWFGLTQDQQYEIQAGDSVVLDYFFATQNLQPGLYENEWTIKTNIGDFIIPVELEVESQQKSLSYPTCSPIKLAYIGDTISDSVSIYNQACEAITVNNIVYSSSNFIIDTSSFYIAPYSISKFEVKFFPDSIKSYTEQLYLNSTAGIDTFCIFSYGVGSPKLEISPNPLFKEVAECKDSLEYSYWIKNTGNADLIYQIKDVGSYIDSTSSVTYTLTGQTTNHIFSVPSTSADSVILTITLNGDFDSSTEYADLEIEGDFITKIPGSGAVAGTDILYTYVLSKDQINKYLNYNSLEIQIKNSSSVNPGIGQQLNEVNLRLVPLTQSENHSPKDGSVLPGDSVLVNAWVNTKNQNGGNYSTSIIINYNSPNNPNYQLDFNYKINGTAIASINNDTMRYAPANAYSFQNQANYFYNSGCGILYIDSFNLASDVFDIYIMPDSVLPFSNDLFWVKFSPSVKGTYLDTLTVYTSDGPFEIILLGSSFDPPAINITPSNLSFNVDGCQRDSTKTIIISNSGGPGVLSFNYSNSLSASNNGVTLIGSGGVLFDTISTFQVPVEFNKNLGFQTIHDTIIFSSNDSNNLIIKIPVTVTISDKVCADFSSSNVSNCSGEVDFTNKSSNSPTSTNWDFGDGTSSTQTNPNHTFTSAGTHSVSLISCNGVNCDTVLNTVEILALNAPERSICLPRSSYGYMTYGIDEFSLNSSSYSSSTISTGYQDFACNQVFEISLGQSYYGVIDFRQNYNYSKLWIDKNGDGEFSSTELINSYYSSSGSNSHYIYANSGYELDTPLRMRIGCDRYTYPSDECSTRYGEFEDYTIIIRNTTFLPVASFSYSVQTCSNQVKFTNSSTYGTSYSWDFGDGETSTDKNPLHSYSAGETYVVTLTTINNLGSKTYSRSVTVDPVLVDLNLSKNTVGPNEIFTISDLNNAADDYSWDFGNGVLFVGNPSNFSYSTPGDYTITATIYNALRGCTFTQELPIKVTNEVSTESISKHSLIVYPNPTRSGIKLDLQNQNNINRIQVLNAIGEVILNKTITTLSSHLILNFTSSLSPGSYMIKVIKNDNQIDFAPFVVIK